MEYKETLRAVFDQMVADIYKVEKTNFYLIFIYEISKDSKILLAKKIRAVLKGGGYQTLRDEIKDHLFQEAYYKKHHRSPHVQDISLIA